MKNLQTIKNRYKIVGRSARFNTALESAIKVANTDLTVLIYGESGVGKEVFSKIIHDHSTRKHHAFLAINCGALPEGTINAELFGHEKGAFTGANESRKGYFETVNGGTLFLDEIGEMPLLTQAYLLRVLESGEFIKVGTSTVKKTDTRIIAATHQDLRNLVAQKKFREDLFYRLNIVSITIPSLRERSEDIILLFEHFCIEFAEKYNTLPIELTIDSKDLLCSLMLKGNIRELKNTAERVSVLANDKLVNREMLLELLDDSSKPLPLPILVEEKNQEDSSKLYDWVIDLRKEVNELKSIVLDLLPRMNTGDISNFYGSPINQSTIDPILLPSRQLPNPVSIPPKLKEKENNCLSLVQQEKEMIIKALSKNGGHRIKAAAELEISPRTLYRKIKDYNIQSIKTYKRTEYRQE